VKEDQRWSTSIDVIVQAAAVDIRPAARPLMLETGSNDRADDITHQPTMRRAGDTCRSYKQQDEEPDRDCHSGARESQRSMLQLHPLRATVFVQLDG
jgi:hypothetical protein